jgi:hypothetical protein
MGLTLESYCEKRQTYQVYTIIRSFYLLLCFNIILIGGSVVSVRTLAA